MADFVFNIAKGAVAEFKRGCVARHEDSCAVLGFLDQTARVDVKADLAIGALAVDIAITPRAVT